MITRCLPYPCTGYDSLITDDTQPLEKRLRRQPIVARVLDLGLPGTSTWAWLAAPVKAPARPASSTACSSRRHALRLSVISPPQAAVLAIGAIQRVPVVDEAGQLAVGTRMKVTISADHRVTDGAEAARFLQAFQAALEQPMRLVL